MIALQITDIGSFMNHLLKNGLFDHFLLQEATITQAVTYTIDGTVNSDFYEPEEKQVPTHYAKVDFENSYCK